MEGAFRRVKLGRAVAVSAAVALSLLAMSGLVFKGAAAGAAEAGTPAASGQHVSAGVGQLAVGAGRSGVKTSGVPARLNPPGRLVGAHSAVTSSYDWYLGEGMEEHCSPYRTAQFFGTPESSPPSASDWNCLPDITGATTSFNLSTISPGDLVGAELYEMTDISWGTTVTFRWYNPGNQLIATSQVSVPSPQSEGYSYWAWYYVYDGIGWDSSHINSDGTYSVSVSDSATGGLQDFDFNVTGVPTGSMTVNVAGVPAQGFPVSAEFQGPDGYESVLSALTPSSPQTVPGLTPGPYTVTPDVPCNEAICLVPAQGSWNVTVTANQTQPVTLTYSSQEEGAVDVNITGLGGANLADVDSGTAEVNI